MKEKYFICLSALVTALALTSLTTEKSCKIIEVANMKFVHYNGAVFNYRGLIYIVSGYDVDGGRTRGMEIFNPKTNKINQGASLATSRNGMGEFVLQDKLYIVGGEGPRSGNFLNSVEVYDVAMKKWEMAANFPEDIWDPMTASNGKRAFVIGGRRGYGRTYNDVYEYEFTENRWIKRNGMPIPVLSAGCTFFKDNIYVFGGYSKPSEPVDEWQRSIQVYDVKNDSWKIIGEIPVQLAQAQALAVNDKIYLFSHGVYDESVQKFIANDFIYVYTPSKNCWETIKCSYPPKISPVFLNPPGISVKGDIYITDASSTEKHLTTIFKVHINK